jgi:16S rRNA (cytosine967-C5)-methyltransferase
VQMDATKPLPFAPEMKFDFVLLDAPCSGLGTLQRHPEIRWRMTGVKIQELAELQKTLLENAASQVQVGGMLTYSVCSTEPEEGEAVIADFRGRHTEYTDVTQERLLTLGLDPARFLTTSNSARTFTHRDNCESFFVCVLHKKTR